MKPAVILLLIGLIFISCKKNQLQSFQNNAEIDGRNPCKYLCLVGCPCACGNLYFHFRDTAYTANIPIDNPEIFNFGSDTKFPVYVSVNWENTTRCGVTAIKITSYKIQ